MGYYGYDQNLQQNQTPLLDNFANLSFLDNGMNNGNTPPAKNYDQREQYNNTGNNNLLSSNDQNLLNSRYNNASPFINNNATTNSNNNNNNINRYNLNNLPRDQKRYFYTDNTNAMAVDTAGSDITNSNTISSLGGMNILDSSSSKHTSSGSGFNSRMDNSFNNGFVDNGTTANTSMNFPLMNRNNSIDVNYTDNNGITTNNNNNNSNSNNAKSNTNNNFENYNLQLRIKESQIQYLELQIKNFKSILAKGNESKNVLADEMNSKEIELPENIINIFKKLSNVLQRKEQELDESKKRLESILTALALHPSNSISKDGRYDVEALAHRMVVRIETLTNENKEFSKMLAYGRAKEVQIELQLYKKENAELKETLRKLEENQKIDNLTNNNNSNDSRKNSSIEKSKGKDNSNKATK